MVICRHQPRAIIDITTDKADAAQGCKTQVGKPQIREGGWEKKQAQVMRQSLQTKQSTRLSQQSCRAFKCKVELGTKLPQQSCSACKMQGCTQLPQQGWSTCKCKVGLRLKVECSQRHHKTHRASGPHPQITLNPELHMVSTHLIHY